MTYQIWKYELFYVHLYNEKAYCKKVNNRKDR